jgi:hypothetical protein
MTRALVGTTSTGVTAGASGSAAGEPGYLVEILFPTPLRLSTRGQVAWSGQTWLPWRVSVQGLTVDAQGSESTGSLVIGNADYSISALILLNGIAQRGVNIWKFYSATPGASDPVQIFAGLADAASFDPANRNVSVTLGQANTRALDAPRFYITAENGFNFVPAPGSFIDWDGERFELTPEN